jgi:hypothetical protein
MLSMRNLQTLAGLVLALTIASGCGGNGNPAAPFNQPGVALAVDVFEYSANGFSGATQTATYSMTTTASVMEVTHLGTITSGQGTLIIRDNANAQVYSGDLRTLGAFLTSSGGIGPWQIEVRLTDVSGTFGFTVRKPS